MDFLFLARGYVDDIIIKGWQPATQKTGESLLNPSIKKKENPLLPITTYKGDPPLKEIISKYWTGPVPLDH